MPLSAERFEKSKEFAGVQTITRRSSSSSSSLERDVHYGRPEMNGAVEEATRALGVEQRVLVAGKLLYHLAIWT